MGQLYSINYPHLSEPAMKKMEEAQLKKYITSNSKVRSRIRIEDEFRENGWFISYSFFFCSFLIKSAVRRLRSIRCRLSRKLWRQDWCCLNRRRASMFSRVRWSCCERKTGRCDRPARRDWRHNERVRLHRSRWSLFVDEMSMKERNRNRKKLGEDRLVD